MDKKFAIFDMDGTLVDSMECWNQLTEEYLCRHGIRDVPREYLEETAVLPTRQTVEFFARKMGLQDTPESAERELWSVMRAHYEQDIPLKPGAGAYLQRLHEQGVAMAVVSATQEELMHVCLRRQKIEGLFTCVLSCVSLGVTKERPDIYNLAAEKLGAPGPAETAVYEDALLAGTTAKKAGYYLVAVQDPSSQQSWPALKELADEALEHW